MSMNVVITKKKNLQYRKKGQELQLTLNTIRQNMLTWAVSLLL